MWNREKQDFEDPSSVPVDYISRLASIDVEVVELDAFEQYAPNYQSDLFRWWFLQNNGGFYLDTDQIILRSFASIPLKHKIIYCTYNGYCPVGVIGAQKDSKIVGYIVKNLPRYSNPSDYNSMGPWMFRDVLNKMGASEQGFNAPSTFFYPVPFSDMVPRVYDGSMMISPNSYALHWFGGHPKSQAFNKHYTEEFATHSEDTISKFLRKKKII